MTQYDDPLKQGRAYYARAIIWGTDNQFGAQYPSGSRAQNQDEARGIPHSQTITYEVGTASTSLASGIFFTTATLPGGTLTCTGVLVSAGVATLDVPRAIMITASTDNSTSVFTIVGTDGYGSPLAVKMIGPTGNTLGNNGSFVFSPSAFKTVTSASQVGTSTAGLQIGSGDVYGLPFRIANVGKVLNIQANGIYVATAGFSTTAAGGTVGPVFPGFAATGAHTASSADVRGMIGLPTTNLANGSRRFTFAFIAPTVGVAETADTKENSYGLTPATG
jgi:hypothetical protein